MRYRNHYLNHFKSGRKQVFSFDRMAKKNRRYFFPPLFKILKAFPLFSKIPKRSEEISFHKDSIFKPYIPYTKNHFQSPKLQNKKDSPVIRKNRGLQRKLRNHQTRDLNWIDLGKSWLIKLRSKKTAKQIPQDLSPPPLTKKGSLKVSMAYYFGFFLLLGLLPLFYFDSNNRSVFLNWVEAHGLPQNHNTRGASLISSDITSIENVAGNSKKDPEASQLPQVVLLKSDPRLNEGYPKFQAGFDLGMSPQGNNPSQSSGSSDLPSTNINKEEILNYEATNEVISEDIIGDWGNENNQEVFENDVNPFTLEQKDFKKTAFDHRDYKVASGDSLWSISKKFNISIDSLISLNRIASPQGLAVDSKLLIPRVSGIYYQVKKKDSLYKIAQAYRVKIEDIQTYNELDGYLQVGKTLFLPGAKYSRFQKDYVFGNIFISPVEGTLTSTYGLRRHPIKAKRLFHTGIDIAKNNGDRVRSAADGVVVQSGPNGGYGKYVLIKHALGYETAYAHLSTIWVKPGQKVKKGQYLGRVGNTGFSTGPHLHFEVKHNGKFINPLRFLKY